VSLLDCSPAELRLLAEALQRVVRGFDGLFARPFPYVMAVHQAPTPAVLTPDAASGLPPGVTRAGDAGEPGPRAAHARTAGVDLGDSGAPGVRTPTDAPTGHLHVEFYPPLRTAEKLKYLAGSEQGAGAFISDVLPEDSAAELREAIARGA
jgi:UDPglucose--hexose-1-phosphate uridylyltransferase